MILTYKFKLDIEEKEILKIEHIFDSVSKLKQMYINDLKDHRELPNRAIDLVRHYQNIDSSIVENVDYSALVNVMFDLCDKASLNENTEVKSYTTRVTNLFLNDFPIKDSTVFLPKVGRVKYRKSRELPKDAKILKYIVSKDRLNDYFIGFVFETHDKPDKLNKYDNVLGLDYSAKHLAVDNNGRVYDLNIPGEKESYEKIKKYQKQLANYQKDSINYKKTVYQINKTYSYLNNYRKDYLHKLSTKMSNEYDAVVAEDLSMKQLISKFGMGSSTNRNSYYSFLEMLNYKLKAKGKRLIKVGQYFPSSKLCSNCGYKKDDLTIDIRNWTCPNCGTKHDRDINAAINIRNEGIRLLNNYA